MNHHQLTAWIGSRRVGILRYDDESGLFAFNYDDEWSSSDTSYPISPALPFKRPADLSNERHSVSVRRFFENLHTLDDVVAYTPFMRESPLNMYWWVLASFSSVDLRTVNHNSTFYSLELYAFVNVATVICFFYLNKKRSPYR